MKLSVLVAAVVSAASAVSASPVHRKRQMGGIFMCTGANATGTCQYQVYDMMKCHQLEEPFYNNVDTFVPDGEPFECSPMASNCSSICTSPTGCTFGTVDFEFEHRYNMGALGWNHLFASFECAKKSTGS